MNIFANSKSIISDIINRIMNCKEIKDLYVGGQYREELDKLYPEICIKNIKKFENITDGIVYLRIESLMDLKSIEFFISDKREENDFVIYYPGEKILLYEEFNKLGKVYSLNMFSDMRGYLLLIGKTFDTIDTISVPDTFRVLAIVHFYNEVDILDKTIEYLLSQEIDIYLIDNWSQDGSYEVAKKYHSIFPNRIFLERFPVDGKNSNYEWYKQLERTEQIAKELNYDWFLHYDTDEIRISPWKNITLRKAIYYIDSQGYNCIENTVIDFKLIEEETNDSNIFMKDTFFDFRHKKLWFDQVKTWKKSTDIELKSSGGHFVHIQKPKIYPLKILNRHYPFRSIKQARKKVFYDRLPRFKKEKKERGWHGQYDRVIQEKDLLSDSSQLLLWNKDTFDQLYIPLFLECGLKWEEEKEVTKIDFPKIENKRIIIYGAGRIGKRVYLEVARSNTIVGWVDSFYQQYPMIFCKEIIDPAEIVNDSYDMIIIAVKQINVRQEILLTLNELAVQKEKIFLC